MGDDEPLPFSSLGTRRKRVTLTVAHTLSGSAAFVSLSSANDFDLRSRAVPQPLAAGAPRGRGTSRDGHLLVRFGGLARLASRWREPINGAVLGLVAQLVRARA
jgi:hypothetical protein